MNINRPSSGLAGAPLRPLEPPSTRPPRFPAGPFGAGLRPTLDASRRGRYSDCLQLGLLVTMPDRDGYGAEELRIPGYHGQAVSLVARTRTQFAVENAIVFDRIVGALVKGVALFNEGSEVEAFGVLRPYTSAGVPPSRLEFPPFQILVNRVRLTL